VLGGTHTEAKNAPHPLKPSPRLSSTEACRHCHEFRFADARPSGAPERSQWMQRTWTEHHDGDVNSESNCASCHMPRTGEHTNHRFVGGHDEALVRSALAVSAKRVSPTRVELTLTPANVTHAVPTGDLFRRLLVSVETGRAPAQVRYLARHHQRVGNGQRLEVADDRPFARATTLSFELRAEERALPARYRVVYQRVDHLVDDDESRAVLSGELELASGELPVRDAPPPAVTVTRAGCGASGKPSRAPWMMAGLLLFFGGRRGRVFGRGRGGFW
jgi:hypothetical protein